MRRHSIDMLTIPSFIMLFIFGLASPVFAKTIEADNKRVIYQGRVFKQDGVVKLGYPGTVAKIKFKGSQLDMTYHSNSDRLWLDVIINGADAQRVQLPQGENTVTLFMGEKAIYELELHKRVESWQAIWNPIAFTVPKGKFYKPAKLPERKILVVGDSIAAGASIDIRPGDEANGNHTSNGRLSFGCVLARKLNAQCHLIAYGGRGITRDWEGSTSINNAPVFYERTLADSKTSQWDHSQYQADLVIVELGQNDFNQGIPDERVFVNAYTKLVKKVQADMPGAKVILMESPMQSEASLSRKVLSHYLDEVMKNLKYKDVAKQSIQHYPGRGSVDSHPVAAEHEKIAQELLPTARRVTGWK